MDLGTPDQHQVQNTACAHTKMFSQGICGYMTPSWVIPLVQENSRQFKVMNKMREVSQQNRYFLHAKILNKSDVAPRNRALDRRGLESPSPIFQTLILSLVSFPQTVHRPLPIPTCCSGCSSPLTLEHFHHLREKLWERKPQVLVRTWRRWNPAHCQWEGKMMQSLWKTVWRFLKNFKVE